MTDLSGKKVVFIIASDNFRDEEFNEPFALLRAQRAQVTVASSSLGSRTGMLGGKAEADTLIGDVRAADYDAVVFIGGTGSSEYFDDSTAHQIARDAERAERVLAAICIAPSTLANAGVLQSKKVTSFPSEKANLIAKGATFTGAAVQRDGLVITAEGPGAAKGFAKAIVSALSG